MGKKKEAQDKQEQELLRITGLKDRGSITATEYGALRSKLLGIPDAPSAPPSAPPPVTPQTTVTTVTPQTGVNSLEDAEAKARREAKLLCVQWIGTRDTPNLGAGLWDTLVLGTAGDEQYRRDLAEATAGNPLKQLLFSLFRDSGKGIMPLALVGDGLATQIARAASREWLRRLASLYCGHIVWLSNKDLLSTERKKIIDEQYKLFDDQETAAQSQVILSAVGKSISSRTSLHDKLSEKDTKV